MAEFSLNLNDDQEQIRTWVHDFAADVVRPVAEEWDEREEFPWPVVEQAAEIGLYSFDFMAQAMMGDPTGLTMPVAMEEMFWGDAGIALSIFGMIAAAGVALLVTAGGADPSGLHAELNLFRYRPTPVVLRVEAQPIHVLLRELSAAISSGVPFDALRVSEGHAAVFFPNNGGREGFQMMAVAFLADTLGVGFNFRALKLASVSPRVDLRVDSGSLLTRLPDKPK